MKRVLAVLAILGLLAGSSIPARAQPQPWTLLNGNLIYAYTASQSVVNSASAINIFTVAIPMTGLFATPPSANITDGGATSGLGVHNIQGFPAGMPFPLHISLIGALSYASGTIQLAANFGGGQTGAATVAMLNSFTPTAANGNQGLGTAANPLNPIRIDCWVIPVATASGVLNSLGSAMLSCRVEITTGGGGQTGNATAAVINVASYTATGFSLASPQVLNIIWQWGTAAAGNALMIQSATATLGW